MSGQYSGEVCVADDGLINPAYFPCKSATLDTSLITGSGDRVAAIGTQVLTTTQAAETSWKGLQSPGVFETPDSEVVYALMQPAVKGATDMNGVTGRLCAALHTYAAELEGIKPDLADLEERAAAFRERAQKGYEVSNWEARGWLSNFETGLDGNAVPRADADEMTTISWKEHGPAVEKNKSLLHEHNAILERISTAATTCANAIQRELKMVCVAPAQAITAEMLESSDLSVWGSAVEEKRNCTESVGHGLGSFWHNTWTGAASLIGRDATTGEWSWETAGKTWWGVGDFVVSTLVVTSPISALLLTNEAGRSFYNDRANVAASSWGGLIGWDQQAHLAGENGWHKYEEDGVAALTESVANVGTFFIPVAGAAAGGTKAVLAGTRAGSFVVKAGTHLAEFVVPAGSYLVKGTVKVIDLGVDLTKGGWKGLIDSLTPGPVRPNVLPGITGVATEVQVPLPSKTPVSSSLGLEGAPPVHGSTAPGGGHVPDGGHAPGSTPDSAGGVSESDGKGHAPETDGSASTPDGGGSGTHPDSGNSGGGGPKGAEDESPFVDSNGRDLGKVFGQSNLSKSELESYLQENHPEEYRQYRLAGQWPADVQIPKNGSVLTADGKIDWTQVPNGGYELDAYGNAVKEPYVPQVGELIDRYGPPNGRYTSPVPESGPYGYAQRSLPYVEDPAHYHQYEVIGDLSNLKHHYETSSSMNAKRVIDGLIERGYFSWDSWPEAGKIAPGFGDPGGGRQYQMPLSVDLLIALNVLKEV